MNKKILFSLILFIFIFFFITKINSAFAGIDTDGDGLDDQVEISNGLNPNDKDTDNDGLIDGSPYEGLTDSDHDGIVNALDPDSDNDGLNDGLEMGINTALAPSDTDQASPNFKTDMDISTKTNPILADTDGDGLTDGEEDKNHNGLFEPKGQDGVLGTQDDETNPLLLDTDGDGMSDSYEINYNLNPNDPTDANKDYDNDGLTNLQEYHNGINSLDPWDSDCDDDGLLDGDPREGFGDTDKDGIINALDSDSDNDGLPDGLEGGMTTSNVGTGTDPDKFVYDNDPSTTTNPLIKDTDGDGLLDGEEDINHNGQVDKGESDPNNQDLIVTVNPTVTYPENNTIIYSRRPLIRGVGQKDIVLEIMDNGDKLGEVTVDEDGTFSMRPQTDLELGEHFLKAQVKNVSGNIILSSAGTNFTIMPFAATLTSSPRNYPNPFNPDRQTTAIYYELNQDSAISIAIFNLRGEKIFEREYDSGSQGGSQGVNQIVWDGKDDYGDICASGIYLGAVIVRDSQGSRIIDRFKIAIIR